MLVRVHAEGQGVAQGGAHQHHGHQVGVHIRGCSAEGYQSGLTGELLIRLGLCGAHEPRDGLQNHVHHVMACHRAAHAC